MQNTLDIHDFALFQDTIQNMTKVTDSAKITFTESGFHSSVKASVMKKEKVGRLDVKSTSVSLQKGCEDVTIATRDLTVLSTLLMKIIKSHTPKSKKNVSKPDYSDVSIVIDDMTINLKSSSLQTKINLVEPKVVSSIAPFDHTLNKIADVNVFVDDLNEILSSNFIFKTPDNLSVEIAHKDDMLKNAAYAIVSDPSDPHTNSITLKFGNILCGDLTRKIYIDMPRISLLSLFPVESLKVELNNEPCAISNFVISGEESGFKSEYRLIFKYLAAPIIDNRAGQLV